MPSGARRRSVARLVLPAGLVLAAAAAAVAFVVLRSGTVDVPGPVALRGYSVVYRVEDLTREDTRVTTEVLEVRRPFDGRYEQRSGKPPGGDVQTGRLANRLHQWTLRTTGNATFGFLRPPGGPPRDASLAALRDASRAGRAEVAGSERIAGRACTVFAIGPPPPDPVAPPGRDHVELCVSAEGIILRESWRIGDRLARVAEAVRVSTRVPGDDRFRVGRTPTPGGESELLALQLAVEDTEEPASLTVELDPPAGWRLARSAAVAESRGQGGPPSQVFSQAFVRGTELVIVDRSIPGPVQPVWDPSEGIPVELGGGPARIVYFIDRVEVRAVGASGYARVAAPSRATALRFARALTRAG